MTEFSEAITPRSSPAFIVAGADGNLWFTQEMAGQVGRITPQGKVTEFDVGGNAPDPDGIAAGPDGNLWFSIRGQDAIGRITPSGTITRFSAGITKGAAPTGITAGPDDNLWFTEVAGGRVGRISPGPLDAASQSGGTGSPPGASGSPPSGRAPHRLRIASLRVTPARFHARQAHVRFLRARFVLDRSATVAVRLVCHGRTVRRLTRAGHRGPNSIALTARLSRRRLAPGRYTVVISARGVSARARFVVA